MLDKDNYALQVSREEWESKESAEQESGKFSGEKAQTRSGKLQKRKMDKMEELERLINK